MSRRLTDLLSTMPAVRYNTGSAADAHSAASILLAEQSLQATSQLLAEIVLLANNTELGSSKPGKQGKDESCHQLRG